MQKIKIDNFKKNIANLKNDKCLHIIFIFFYFIALLIYIFPIFGIYFITVFSNSDKNGIYLTFKENKNYNYKINDYVSYCLSDKIALESAISYGLPSKGGICKNGSYPLLKHICGLPRQEVKYFNNHFYLGVEPQFINKNYMSNEKLIHKIDWKTNPKYIVPESSYFICGENELSFDSRYYGAINVNDIVGISYRIIPIKTFK